MSAWTDPERPGVPLNPERNGWHWLYRRSDGFAAPYHWTTATDPRNGYWLYPPDWEVMPEDKLIIEQDYLGPCLTPAEVAAQVAAAAAVMREAAALVTKQKRVPFMHIDAGKYSIGIEIAAAIAALPIEHGDALAAAVAQAVKQEREACAVTAERGPPHDKTSPLASRNLSYGIAAHDIAAAIRARGEGGGHE